MSIVFCIDIIISLKTYHFLTEQSFQKYPGTMNFPGKHRIDRNKAKWRRIEKTKTLEHIYIN